MQPPRTIPEAQLFVGQPRGGRGQGEGARGRARPLVGGGRLPQLFENVLVLDLDVEVRGLGVHDGGGAAGQRQVRSGVGTDHHDTAGAAQGRLSGRGAQVVADDQHADLVQVLGLGFGDGRIDQDDGGALVAGRLGGDGGVAPFADDHKMVGSGQLHQALGQGVADLTRGQEDDAQERNGGPDVTGQVERERHLAPDVALGCQQP